MSGTETYELKGGGYSGRFLERFPRSVAAEWLADTRALRAQLVSPWGAPRPEKGRVNGGGEVYFVKRHRRDWVKAFAEMLVRRPTPARRGFEIGRRLAGAKVSAVRPLGFFERRFPGESFLVLEDVPGVDLRTFILGGLEETGGSLEGDGFKAALWKALGGAVARLHAAAVRQKDLKAPNILVERQADGLLVTLVDLEGMQYLGGLLPDKEKRARDLARLAVSLREPTVQAAGVGEDDWESLLWHYLDACRAAFASEEDLAWWVETTAGWAEKKEARSERKTRPIY